MRASIAYAAMRPSVSGEPAEQGACASGATSIRLVLCASYFDKHERT